MQRTECNEQGSKVDDFFKQINGLYEEMVCQKDLRGEQFWLWPCTYHSLPIYIM